MDTLEAITPGDPIDDQENEKYLLSFLKNNFSHTSFLSENQLFATRQALLDSDLLVSLCQGKSITYQLPAAIQLKGTTVVIMPTEQCIRREKNKGDIKNVNVWWIDSSDAFNSMISDIQNVIQTTNKTDDLSPSLAKLIYITCKRFVESEVFLDLLTELNKLKLLNQFVVEEIQCLESERFPEYGRLVLLRNQYPTVSITVLTSALTGKLQHRILNTIKVHFDAFCAVEPSIRENIYYSVLPRYSLQESVQTMAQFITQNNILESGIIFCFDREEANLIFEQLQNHDIPAVILDPEDSDERVFDKNYQQWKTDVVPVGIATQTFRFNIHKKNVRFVFHYSLPASIEEYLQDTNLAGRDDQFARCIIFEDLSDMERLRYQFTSQMSIEQIKQMAIYADNSVTPRRVLLEQYCTFLTGSSIGKCDNSERSLESIIECDLSSDVKSLLTCIQNSFGYPISKSIDIFRGVTNRESIETSNSFGEGSHYTSWEATRLAYLLYVYDHIEFDIHNSILIPVITERGSSFLSNPSSVFKMSEPAPFPKSRSLNNKKRPKPMTAQINKKAKKRRIANAQKTPLLPNNGHFPSLHPLFIQYIYQAYPQFYQNLLLMQNQWAQRTQGGGN